MEAKTDPKDSNGKCLNSLFAGAAGSWVMANPLPLLLSLVECVPTANAQIKVGGESQVNLYTTLDQKGPAVALLGNGNFVTIWESYGQDGDGNGIYGQILDGTGGKVGSEFHVTTYTTSTQMSPDVKGLNNGNFVVVWDSDWQDGDQDGIFGQLFDSSGTKVGNEFRLNTNTVGQQQNPSVAALGNGYFVVTWTSYGDGDSYGIFGQILTESRSGVGGEFQINTYTTNAQLDSSVSALGNNKFVVVWDSYGQDGDQEGIFGQIFDNFGTKIGSEFQANSYTVGTQQIPVVAGLSNGNFVVTWESPGHGLDNSGSGVYGQIFYGSGSKINNEFQLNTYTSFSQYQQKVTALSNGSFLVTWTSDSQDGSSYGVYGQLFDSLGSKNGGEFQVNTYTALGQSEGSVAALNSGNFIIAWSSSGQDGDGLGIFSQIFSDQIAPMTTGNPASASSVGSTTTTTISAYTSLGTAGKAATPSVVSSSKNTNSLLWGLIGAGGAVLCLIGTSIACFKKRAGGSVDDSLTHELNEIPITTNKSEDSAEKTSSKDISISISEEDASPVLAERRKTQVGNLEQLEGMVLENPSKCS